MNNKFIKFFIIISLFSLSFTFNCFKITATNDEIAKVTLEEGKDYEIGSIYKIEYDDNISSWYVIADTDENLRLLSKYNLKISNLTQDETGATNETNFDPINARNNDNNTYCKSTSSKGCNAYAKGTEIGPNGELNWYTNGILSGTVTEDSSIKKKVDKFVDSLNLGDYLISSGLITKWDLTNLGCTTNSCKSSQYSWLYSTDYWTSWINTGIINQVWFVLNTGSLRNTDPRYYSHGIRPVITIKKSIIMHNINTEVIGNGNITLNKYSAKEGDVIEITISADKEYELEALTAKYGEENNIEIKENSFLMPNEDVVVTAKFKEIEKNADIQKNPSTFDNIYMFVILGLISFIIILIIIYQIIKNKKIKKVKLD